MPTLLDTPEFSLAKTTLDTTLQRIEKARQDRLESVRKYLETSETELERVKQQALELPALIARYRAEIAKLEATTGADILREAMGLECPACNDLEDARQFMEPPREPAAGLDLRTCIGAQCEALDDIAGVRNQGQHFIVLEPGNYQTVKIRYALDGRYYECYVGAVQPARLLKQPQPPGEVVEVQSPKPAMLDLRTLPVGTLCEATGPISGSGRGISASMQFMVVNKEVSAVTIEDAGYWTRVEPMQPARVVSQPAAPLKVGDRVEVGEGVQRPGGRMATPDVRLV